MMNLREKALRFFYLLCYGIKVEKGFKYKRICNYDLSLLMAHHHVMINMGWEQCSDFDSDFDEVWCWYRIRSN